MIAAGFLVTLSLAFILLYQYLLNSPYMQLERVLVRGVEGGIRQALVEASGLNRGPGLLGLNLHALKQKMEAHPWVDEVQLERRFPHTLVVRAKQEIPVALVLTDNLYYINRRGEIIQKAAEWKCLDLPVITGISDRRQTNGGDLSAVARVLQALERESGMWSLSELSEIHLQRPGMLSLYFGHLAAEIRLPSGLVMQPLERSGEGEGASRRDGAELAGSMRKLRKVAHHLTETGRMHQVRAIDLNYDEGVVVSFGKG
jgi:cell division protein FtsQ